MRFLSDTGWSPVSVPGRRLPPAWLSRGSAIEKADPLRDSFNYYQIGLG